MSIVFGQYICEVHILSDDAYDMSSSEVLAEVDKELSISDGEVKLLEVALHDLVLIIES